MASAHEISKRYNRKNLQRWFRLLRYIKPDKYFQLQTFKLI
jgi:hypothetical protein